jgi:N-methylhydantoinase B
MLNKGEVARLHTGTGGGYGSPSKRPREMVLRDLKEGYITPEQAARDYGVAQSADRLAE